LAKEVAAEFAELHKQVSFALIATSPYRRCVETAMVISEVLRIPIVLDQEIGEVWEEKMRKDPRPWRPPKALKHMLKGHKVLNPHLPEGGYKLFGKEPAFPETLAKARNRMVVRFETYIEQSENLHQNFILCTHADGIAAALHMFERGNADISKMGFCSRITATRKVVNGEVEAENTFAKRWEVDVKGIEFTIFEPESSTKKLFEDMHLDACQENQELVARRREGRTQTDKLFDARMTNLLAGVGYESEGNSSMMSGCSTQRSGMDFSGAGPGGSRAGSSRQISGTSLDSGRKGEKQGDAMARQWSLEELDVPEESHNFSPARTEQLWSGSRGFANRDLVLADKNV
jgi:broad specificity phosphatase PhoE